MARCSGTRALPEAAVTVRSAPGQVRFPGDASAGTEEPDLPGTEVDADAHEALSTAGAGIRKVRLSDVDECRDVRMPHDHEVGLVRSSEMTRAGRVRTVDTLEATGLDPYVLLLELLRRAAKSCPPEASREPRGSVAHPSRLSEHRVEVIPMDEDRPMSAV